MPTPRRPRLAHGGAARGLGDLDRHHGLDAGRGIVGAGAEEDGVAVPERARAGQHRGGDVGLGHDAAAPAGVEEDRHEEVQHRPVAEMGVPVVGRAQPDGAGRSVQATCLSVDAAAARLARSRRTMRVGSQGARKWIAP